jgi:hypothetical protein
VGAAWRAGLSLAIPHTPHALSLDATNTNNATLQSSSLGTGETRYGFEFTIPLTLQRYLGGGQAPDTAQLQPVSEGRDTPTAAIQDFQFQPARLEVAAGATIV